MRTLIDIPEQYLQDLTTLGQQEKLSRAELVRRAIAAYLSDHKPQTALHGFGLWKDTAVDGVEYQQAMRSEWDRE
jgi:hypothetical protein